MRESWREAGGDVSVGRGPDLVRGGREFEPPPYPSGRGREPGGPGAYLENHILTIDIS